MATKTAGSLATTSLVTVQWPGKNSVGGGTIIAAADIATIANDILSDQVPAQLLTQPFAPGAFSSDGILTLPGGRGTIKLLPGDWVAVDPQGWPIVISGNSLPATLTAVGSTHTSSTLVDAFTSSVLALGWTSGMAITGTNVPASTVISAIASDGKSLTLSKAATGTGNTITFTVSSWTHS